MRCVLAVGPQGDIDLLEFMSWVQHMAATPTGVTPNMVTSPCNIEFTLTIYQMEPTLNSRSLFLHITGTFTDFTIHISLLEQVWYYKEQAARGNSAAILNLAVCHLSGVGMLKDSTAGVCVCVCARARARVCQLSGNAAELCCRCGVDEGRGIAGQRYGGAEEPTRESIAFYSLCGCVLCAGALSWLVLLDGRGHRSGS